MIALGCGSVVVDPAAASGAGGAGAGGAGGASTGGADVCKRDFPGLTWTYQTPDGFAWSSGLVADQKTPLPSFDRVGAVTESSPGELAVDFCPPNADCADSVHRIEMTTKEEAIDLAIPVGTFVRVRLDVTSAGYEQPPFTVLGLTISNAPTWGGLENPTESGERLWGVLSSGTVHDPVTVEQGDAHCEAEDGGMWIWARWDLRVAVAGTAVVLDEGESGVATVSSGAHAGAYAVRNLQSHADQIEGAFPASIVVTRD